MTGHFAKLVPSYDDQNRGAWQASQRIALTPRSIRPTAAAVVCIVVADKVACFKPAAGVLGVPADWYSPHSG